METRIQEKKHLTKDEQLVLDMISGKVESIDLEDVIAELEEELKDYVDKECKNSSVIQTKTKEALPQ